MKFKKMFIKVVLTVNQLVERAESRKPKGTSSTLEACPQKSGTRGYTTTFKSQIQRLESSQGKAHQWF